MSASFSPTPAAAPSSGFRLRPVHLASLSQSTSVSPSPPPSSVYSTDVTTASAASVPHSSQVQDPHALPPLALSPTHPNAAPRPWSPSSGVREIDAAPPPRRTNLPPPPTGHELMALFPTPSPSSPPTYAAPPNSASGSGSVVPGAPVPIPIPTSGWFINEERRFFARGGKEIVRLRKEEAVGPQPTGTGQNGSEGVSVGVGIERERDGDSGKERDMGTVKRSPPVSNITPSASVPHPTPSSSRSSQLSPYSRPHTTSHPPQQQQILTLNQSQSPYRQPPPPPPRDREPLQEKDRGADADVQMQVTAPPQMRPRTPQVNVAFPPPQQQQLGQYQAVPPPPPHARGHGRTPSYDQPVGVAPHPPQQPSYVYSQASPPPPPSHPQAPPPHTHARGYPPTSASSSHSRPSPHPQYSVAPPNQAPAQAPHMSYSVVPQPSQPPPRHQGYSASPPYSHDSYTRPEAERFGVQEREMERGRDAYPSPSPSREGYAHPPPHPSGGGYSEGYTGGSAYLAASERRRAGKHTRRVIVRG